MSICVKNTDISIDILAINSSVSSIPDRALVRDGYAAMDLIISEIDVVCVRVFAVSTEGFTNVSIVNIDAAADIRAWEVCIFNVAVGELHE